jgi:hypothetical protein
MKKQLLYGLCVTVFISSSLCADTPDLLFNNIRKIGMGNAGVATVRDDSSLYINPAGLNAVESFHLRFPRLRAELGTDYLDNASEFNDLMDSNNDQQAILQGLVPFKGGLNFQISPLASYVQKDFGIGAFGGIETTTQIYNKVSPTFKMQGNTDFAIAAGMSHKTSFLEHPVILGISGKFINRSIIYNDITGADGLKMGATELIDAINDDTLNDRIGKTYGVSGFGIDLGLLTPFEFYGQDATFGMTIRNIAGTLNGNQTVNNQSRDVSVELPITTVLGVAMSPELPYVGKFDLAADYHLYPSTSFFTGLYMGVEKKFFGNFLSLRTGLSEGYPSFGAGVDLFVAHLNYAYFSKELGSVAGKEAMSYHMVELGFLF